MIKSPDQMKAEAGEFHNELLKKHEGWTDDQFKAEYGSVWESMKLQDEFMRMTPEQQKKLRESQAVILAEKKTALDRMRAYAEQEKIKSMFINLLGDRDGKAYVESVLIAVANKPELQKCSPKSIMIASLRAASLKLSLDPAMEQAHLVAYGEEATLIPDYHGLVQLSVNTNYYELAPNVSEVYEGEIAKTDRFSGRVTIEGERVSNVIIGWTAYYKAKNGIERWLYMSNEDCDAHGKAYNPGGFSSPKSPWNAHNGRDRDKMRRKTCLRIFIKKWGNFSPVMQRFIAAEEAPIDAEFLELPDDSNILIPEESKQPKRSREQNLAELGIT